MGDNHGCSDVAAGTDKLPERSVHLRPRKMCSSYGIRAHTQSDVAAGTNKLPERSVFDAA